MIKYALRNKYDESEQRYFRADMYFSLSELEYATIFSTLESAREFQKILIGREYEPEIVQIEYKVIGVVE